MTNISPYQRLIERLGVLETPEETKQLFRKLIDETAAQESANDQGERVKYARQLLDLKEPRSIIKERLMTRFQIGKSTAYRDISAALAIVPTVPLVWDKSRV